MEFILICLGIVGICIIGYIIWYVIYKEYGNTIKEPGCRFIEDGTLEIKERNPSLSKFIKIIADYDAKVKYKPVKLHIGAATVGGVTTGGAYTTGGYNYLSGEKKNGKYKLEAFDQLVFRIQLNEEQYLSAKKSRIAKYLNDKHQIQVIDKIILTEEEKLSVINNLKKSSYLYGGESLKKGFPSYGKCVEIMNWICDPSSDNDSDDYRILFDDDSKSFNANSKPSDANSKPLIENREPTANEWKCPKCGRINQNYVGTCGCGEVKPH